MKQLLFFTLFCISLNLFSQTATVKKAASENYIQISGVVLDDSLQPLPFVSIMLKGTRSGTVSDFYGFFTIVARPGDEMQFFSINHKNKVYNLSDTLTGKHYSIIQILTKDTIQLPEVSVFPWPSKEQFKRAILDLDLSDTDIERAYTNMDNEDVRQSIKGGSMDAAANYRVRMQQQYTRLYQAGQYPSVSLLNPVAWAQFIDAWRKGKLKIK
ncbi:MAG: carboxypeptidase-like regulatory domain-containing protein [Bacteroidia bacterium]|jgi:hypothetical protein|nr:carboxypeptidase-like regulatory domain-containing protein [Bacteroidia bacterium]